MNFKKNRKKDYEPDPFRRSDRRTFLQFITDNKKLVMPLILIAAVCLTVLIALHANQRIVEETYAGTGTDPGTEEASMETGLTPLVENTDENIEKLVMAYFDAYGRGDMETIRSLYEGLEDTEELKLSEVSKYIDSVDSVKIYTKPGPDEGTWIAYIYTEVTFRGYNKALPGMQTMYICTRDDGSLYINGDVVEGKVADYISEVSLQADVVDLNNSVAAEYNDMITGDEELSRFLGEMSAQIQVSVDEALATMEAADATEGQSDEEETPEETQGTDETDTQSDKVIIKALDVVNIRTSDSETADKISKTQPGQEFEELELLPNGWSRIRYENREAYVKSEYFELVSGKRKETTSAAASSSASATEASSTSDAASSASSSAAAASSSSSAASASSSSATAASSEKTEAVKVGQKTGRMKTIDSVKLRSGQGTDTQAYMTLYPGTFVEVIENYANGWSKVKYEERTGYIKSEFLE